MRSSRGAAPPALAIWAALAKWIALATSVALLSGCATAPPAPDGWIVRDVAGGDHVLASAAPPILRPGAVLTVVIEGDGPAHDAAGRPTADPTPRRPVGLTIAQAWPIGPVAWLARPCQFTRARDRTCQPQVWSRDRFGETALEALDAGVTALKVQSGAEQVRLVGWSGGGVMAAALALRRDDVAGVATFATPLDVADWTAARGLTSLPLADDVRRLAQDRFKVPSVHLLGQGDKVVDPAAGRVAADRLGGDVRVVDEAHACCWARRAPEAAAALAIASARPAP